MKKISILILFLFLSANTLFSQNDLKEEIETQQNFSELKVNALFLIIGAFDVTYERTINEESAFGVSLYLPFDEEISDTYKFSLSPYYRFYFGKKYATGFFAEGFGMLNSTRDESYNYNYNTNNYNYTYENNTDFALGVGVGGKWVTKRGVIFEISAGIGRNLLNNNYNYEIIGKGGISVGYRF
ncbi:DUF3575 domain-containing protein [Polaribacter vadi]|uniref:DUF3575 domain-containing protein n=1 Tax=Polaribacter vadi TaxID=1774273 RepID=UPI0030EC3F63|tara:strand:+ start:6841 stop:7392 length:552 start_codon:yes stop_codon:yes gene_type:complete